MQMMTNIRAATLPDRVALVLAEAQGALSRGNVEAAIDALRAVLNPESTDEQQSMVRVNLAAALCQHAQSLAENASAIGILDEAASLLKQAIAALPARTRNWALARTNLAVVLLTRGNRANAPADILMAHLALDGTEEVFATAADEAGRTWSRAVRDHLTEFHERRASLR